MPTIGNAQLKLLEKLCNACAVSGDEGEVRKIVLEELKGHAGDVRVDALGNVLVTRSGSGKKRLKVMVSAHMDEVGFMLVADDGEGLFRFETVGGIDVRQCPGKAVLIGKDHLPGVIGARPIHLTTIEERKQKILLDALRIDIGPGGGKVKPGDRATFATRFQRNGPVLIAKAFDNRLGVVTLLELVKNAPANIDLLAAFTVQEEIGMRGAKVAAYTFNPDLAIVVDATPANDLPGWDDEENDSFNTKLGLGPAIYIADGNTLSDPRLVRHLSETAQAEGIPVQFRQPGGGGTDAGAIHKARSGVPSVSVSVPHRYSHTAASIARLDDWKNTLTLLHAALRRLTPELLASERG
ncbi:MAG: M20/M25/M40 family metallo-hydrolase [Chloroflexi bacterium]|nr:M20/M25/M40 family metallo-hydrolase [Chloroflexota bacterium]